jgi:hypothetical protein
MAEIWKAIAGFEPYYDVSNFGRVRSKDRVVNKRTKGGVFHDVLFRGRILALCPHTTGYVMVHLYVDRVRTPKLVHALVAEAFIGPRPPGAEVRHGDGQKQNCHADNLSYGTHSENENDKLLHGTRHRGESSVSAKLTEADVLKIRSLRGVPQQELADTYGVTFSNISAIQLRKSWRHVSV